MGQAANTGRRAELDDRKRRAAGRINDRGPEVEQIRDFQKPEPAKGATGGAFGLEGQANRRGGSGTQPPAKNPPEMTSRSTRPTRKGGAW